MKCLRSSIVEVKNFEKAAQSCLLSSIILISLRVEVCKSFLATPHIFSQLGHCEQSLVVLAPRTRSCWSSNDINNDKQRIPTPGHVVSRRRRSGLASAASSESHLVVGFDFRLKQLFSGAIRSSSSPMTSASCPANNESAVVAGSVNKAGFMK